LTAVFHRPSTTYREGDKEQASEGGENSASGGKKNTDKTGKQSKKKKKTVKNRRLLHLAFR
jgi:hypothetical protein